jgi:hypothetical protein
MALGEGEAMAATLNREVGTYKLMMDQARRGVTPPAAQSVSPLTTSGLVASATCKNAVRPFSALSCLLHRVASCLLARPRCALGTPVLTLLSIPLKTVICHR